MGMVSECKNILSIAQSDRSGRRYRTNSSLLHARSEGELGSCSPTYQQSMVCRVQYTQYSPSRGLSEAAGFSGKCPISGTHESSAQSPILGVTSWQWMGEPNIGPTPKRRFPPPLLAMEVGPISQLLIVGRSNPFLSIEGAAAAATQLALLLLLFPPQQTPLAAVERRKEAGGGRGEIGRGDGVNSRWGGGKEACAVST